MKRLDLITFGSNRYGKDIKRAIIFFFPRALEAEMGYILQFRM